MWSVDYVWGSGLRSCTLCLNGSESTALRSESTNYVVNSISTTYSRAPVTALKFLLSRGGLLAPLLSLTARTASGLRLDIHLRGSEIHVYRGLTRILTVAVNAEDTVKVSAHSTYESQDCVRGIIRTWGPDDARAEVTSIGV